MAQRLTLALKVSFRAEIDRAQAFFAEAVSPRRADTDVGIFDQQHSRLGSHSNRFKPLTTAKAELRATLQAKRHIRAKLCRQVVQLCSAELQIPIAVEQQQRRCAITGSTGQASTDGNAFG